MQVPKRKSDGDNTASRNKRRDPKIGPAICLQSLESQRREILLQAGDAQGVKRDETVRGYEKRAKKVQLPPEYSKLGIVHRLPSFEEVIKQKLGKTKASRQLYHPSQRPEQQEESLFERTFKRASTLRQKQLVMFEQFYSDLDRAW